MAEAGLEHAGIAAFALLVALGERRHHLVGELRVLQCRDELAARMEPAALAQRDEPLDHRAEILGLGQRRRDLLMLQEGMAEIVEHRLAMGGGAAEAAAAQAVAHIGILFPGLNKVLRGAWRAPRCSRAASSGFPCRDGAPSAPAPL